MGEPKETFRTLGEPIEETEVFFTLKGTDREKLKFFVENAVIRFDEAVSSLQKDAKNKSNVEISKKVKCVQEGIEGVVNKTSLVVAVASIPYLGPVLGPGIVGAGKVIAHATNQMISRFKQKDQHKSAKKIENFFMGYDLEKWSKPLVEVFLQIFFHYHVQVCNVFLLLLNTISQLKGFKFPLSLVGIGLITELPNSKTHPDHLLTASLQCMFIIFGNFFPPVSSVWVCKSIIFEK